MDFSTLKQINEDKAAKQLASDRHEDLLATTYKVSDTILLSTEALIKYLEGHTTKTEVVNQLEEIHTPDVKYVVEALQLLDQTIKSKENVDLSEITKVMQSILDETKLIPKTLPDTPEEDIDYTEHFKNLTEAIKAVEKVVKEQDLVVEPPVVNVPETKIDVKPPDLKPLQNSIKDVVKSVNKIVIPEYKTDNKKVETLLTKSNKLLKDLLDKPVSSGGGGGSSWVTLNAAGIPVPIQLTADGKVPVEAGATSTYESYTDTTTDVNLVYLGKAEAGTATSSAAWQIKRYNKTTGHMSFADDITTFTKVWSDRTTYTY